MYYEEKIINGVLHYRYDPHEEFEEMSKENLTRKLRVYQKELEQLKKMYGIS